MAFSRQKHLGQAALWESRLGQIVDLRPAEESPGKRGDAARWGDDLHSLVVECRRVQRDSWCQTWVPGTGAGQWHGRGIVAQRCALHKGSPLAAEWPGVVNAQIGNYFRFGTEAFGDGREVPRRPLGTSQLALEPGADSAG